jgi:hypothetical protein
VQFALLNSDVWDVLQRTSGAPREANKELGKKFTVRQRDFSRTGLRWRYFRHTVLKTPKRCRERRRVSTNIGSGYIL